MFRKAAARCIGFTSDGESLIVRAGFFIFSPRPDFLLPYGGGVQRCPGLLEVRGVIVMRGHLIGPVAEDALARLHVCSGLGEPCGGCMPP